MWNKSRWLNNQFWLGISFEFKLLLLNDNGYVIKYESVVVSSKVSTSIFEMKTAEWFNSFAKKKNNELNS